ncbi:hypothetical protein HN958_04065 [Candidatus Falkowbacteria bacterium]|jgi:hypothetical protein|nr:hypothetical protein [Candidatus Falkowbacteria bacterium]MBT7007652.1 hypothetical protein [Candidatus Falkowbacteria bacterium]
MLPDNLNSLKIISECPVCRKKQFPADINLVEEREEGHLLHMQCKLCSGSLLVFVNFNDHGANVIGVLTDLQSQEVGKVLSRGPLTADDFLEIYQKMNQEGIVKELLG